MNNQYTAELTDEAIEQLKELDTPYKKKILEGIQTFEKIGIKYKNLNTLGDGLYEIKSGEVRAYFKYAKNRIIIVGFIVLKKTQKAPRRYIEQAKINIDRYIQEHKELQPWQEIK